MRNLTVVILALLLGVSSSCTYFKSKKLFGRKAKSIEVLRAQQDSIRVADSLRMAAEKLKAIELAKLDSLNRAEEAKKQREAPGRYSIIVGSFLTPEYAEGYAGSYIHMGYDAKIIDMEGSAFKLVSAEAHDNLSEAIVRLEQFQDTVELNAWLYVRK